MWGTFLSEPLLIVALVGRRPANQLIRRMPIRARISPFTCLPCRKQAYGVLDHISMDCPPAAGRSHTRYSPVRRSPSKEASFLHVAPRLACVKPVASVHPEPGSNSPLLFILVFPFFGIKFFETSSLNSPARLEPQIYRVVHLASPASPDRLRNRQVSLAAALNRPRSYLLYYSLSCFVFNILSMNSRFISQKRCKGTAFFRTTKFLEKVFWRKITPATRIALNDSH